MPYVRVLNRSVEIHKDPFLIGRSPDGDLVLPEASVSRKHAQIIVFNGKYFLEDLKSRSGIKINDLVVAKGELRDDDQITIGPFNLIFSLHSESSSPRHAEDEIYALKKEFHRELFNQIDVKKISLEFHSDDDIRKMTKSALEVIIQNNQERIPKSVDVDHFVKELMDEILGLGPIEPFLSDPEITEVMVNGSNQIYIEKKGKLILTGKRFMGDEQVRTVIERIVHPIGRRIDESSPMVDARLRDGSRVNAIIPPLSLNGPIITIRKFPPTQMGEEQLTKNESLTKKMLEFLKFCVSNRMNILISGGTGSGKTTLLNVLSGFIPSGERIVTIEDSAELRLAQPHVISLETRPANMEGRGLITIRDLVRNSLRMRPDRIVIGECRGGEAFDLLSAMNTGHDGSLSTIHANSPRDALSRFETLVLMAGMDLPSRAIRQQIASAVQIIIQQSRFSDGSRKITHIVEVTGMEGETFTLQEIYRYKREGWHEDGKLKGRFESSSLMPLLCTRLRNEGHHIPTEWFEN
ncbi:MAG: Flp pilus assembly complex ATPase component TadA [Nitrospirae bacterium]|nr:Flp pilus assembly complex ATPase component TadA [Nitrospirota bacterium]